MGINFSLRSPKSDTSVIMARHCWKKEDLPSSTGLKIETIHWNADKQKVRKSHRLSVEYNHFLKTFTETQEKALLAYRMEFNAYPTSKQFKSFLHDYKQENAKRKDVMTFFEYTNKMIDLHHQRLLAQGKSLSKNNRSNELNQTMQVLLDYEKASTESIGFNSFRLEWYEGFRDWCYDVRKYSSSTLQKHVKNIKAIMNAAVEEELTENKKYKTRQFRIPKINKIKHYLNLDELKQLYDYDFSDNKRLEKARDLFLIGCFTGLRVSDFGQIESHDVQDNSIRIVASKTNSVVRIPMSNKLLTILKKYDLNSPQLSDQKLNKYIKEVCKIVGIDTIISEEIEKGRLRVTRKKHKYEDVSTIYCRRSFATNLYLHRKDMPMRAIMQITGHKTEKSFLSYLALTPDHYHDLMQDGVSLFG